MPASQVSHAASFSPNGDIEQRSSPKKSASKQPLERLQRSGSPTTRSRRTKSSPGRSETYRMLIDLARNPDSGVSMIELRQFSRTEKIQIPDWAIPLGARVVAPSFPAVMSSEVENGAVGEAATWTGRPVAERTGSERITSLKIFKSGFSLRVPLMDTTIYLDYLVNRFVAAGGSIAANSAFHETRRSRSAIWSRDQLCRDRCPRTRPGHRH